MLHFSGFNAICHFWTHMEILLRSFCKASVSAMCSIILNSSHRQKFIYIYIHKFVMTKDNSLVHFTPVVLACVDCACSYAETTPVYVRTMLVGKTMTYSMTHNMAPALCVAARVFCFLIVASTFFRSSS